MRGPAPILVLDDGDLLRLVTTGTPLAAGVMTVWAQLQRGLNAGEYKLTQVNENRINIDHAADATGFVVLVG